ncbi:MAG TPA: ABC transporter ATP-binding protein [Gemmatimonadales bacterium]|nr:ABC transporter ATP-binding protein [Gemmatimonadales bacterium]
MILEAAGVVVRYPGATDDALAGVSLALGAGEIVSVVGPNGGGKSTLLRALLGIQPLRAGQVRLLDRDLAAWSRAEVAQQVGVVVQQEEPAPGLRVTDAVLFGRYARLSPLAAPSAADHAAVHRALERADVVHLRDRFVTQLSGGEWQRVRLARALAQEPRALVLDEPTSALDVRHEMELFELVAALRAEGLGCLVITHRLNLAARYADRLVLLHRGRVVAEGTPTGVLVRERLSDVFEWPVAVTTWCDGAPQVVPLRPGEEQQSAAGPRPQEPESK